VLPGTVASVPIARRWVSAQLQGLPTEVVDTAILLTSEVVTNAVLYAGTEVVVALHFGSDRLRVDVADGSTATPTPRHYGVDATTGRGLSLVEVLAPSWGVEPTLAGKVVWFELPIDLPLSAADVECDDETVAEAVWPWVDNGPNGPRAETPVVEVTLEGLSVELLERVGQHYEALFREFGLIAARPSAPGVDPRLRELITELGTRYGGFTHEAEEHYLTALTSGVPEADLYFRLPAAGARTSEAYGRLLDEADALCSAGQLITLPAAPELVAFRRWMLGEVVRQAAGDPPVRWSESVEARSLSD